MTNDPFPTLDHNLRYMPNEGLYFNVQPWVAQSRTSVDPGVVYDENNGIGFGGHLFDIPPLESTNITHEERSKTEILRSDGNNNVNYNKCDINYVNNNNNNIKVENGELGFGWEEEEVRVGEWDFEQLMKEVPSFSLLDFQVE